MIPTEAVADRPRSLPLGAFALDVEQRVLRGNRGEAPLSPLSVRFLMRLADDRGRTVCRSELIDELWAGNFLVGNPALNRVVSETRRAAKVAGSGVLIETVQKSGYRLHGAWLGHEAARPSLSPSHAVRWAWLLICIALVIGTLAWLLDSAIALTVLSRFPN